MRGAHGSGELGMPSDAMVHGWHGRGQRGVEAAVVLMGVPCSV